MKSILLLASGTVLLASCASVSYPTNAELLSASDTPEHFLVLDPATGARSEPVGPACRNPLVDPRDGTKLRLVRSQSGFGDYRPEKPLYGLAGDQLLRIDCSSGRAVGATPGAP